MRETPNTAIKEEKSAKIKYSLFSFLKNLAYRKPPMPRPAINEANTRDSAYTVLPTTNWRISAQIISYNNVTAPTKKKASSKVVSFLILQTLLS